MASSSQQHRISRNSAYNPPTRSHSMYIQRSGLDEPDILKRRVRSTRGKRSRKTTLFSTRSIPKIPQIENTVDLFDKIINALRSCAGNLRDNIYSSPITARRSLEHKLRWCEDRLSQVEELYDFYKHEIKMRQGARNLETALSSYGVKHGQDKCKSNYKESTQNMCEIEDEFERRMGRFKVKMDGLDGFARLCPGDNFEIFIRNGMGRKWKAKCKIERDGQKWVDNDIEIKGSVKDGLFLRIIEVKKIQANSQLGSFSVRLRNYITSRPMNLSIPVNKIGNIKLRVSIHWQPLSSKEELKIKNTNHESLLSEVFFGSAVDISHDAPPRVSIVSPPDLSPSSPSALSSSSTASNSTFNFESVMFNDHHDQHDSSTPADQVDNDDHVVKPDLLEHESEITTVEEEVVIKNEPTQSPTLDQLIRKLESVLTEHKDNHPQLQQLYEKLEKLDEILQGGKLRKCNLTGSVESALESFSFLDITEVGVKPDKDIRPFDTGYSSTDETQKVDHSCMNGEIPEVVRTESTSTLTKPETIEASSLCSSQDSDSDCQSQTSNIGSTGSKIIDKVLQQHLKFCLRLTEDLGAIGPLKCKERSAVIKLEWQTGIFEKLIELSHAKQPPQTISKAYSPLAASGHDEILLFWAGNCMENPLFIDCNIFLEALKNQFHSVVEGYSRVAEKIHPVIITRILEENGNLLADNFDEDDIISIYQFTDYFLLDNRWNLVTFVTDVAEELLTCGRLLNVDERVVLTQLQMYNKIPFKQSCCTTAAQLLADPDPRISGAAGVYFEMLFKDTHRRAQAVTYCAEALENGDESFRIGACKALERLQGEQVSEQLLFLSKCDTDNVKEAAQTAVSSFGFHSEMSNDEKNAKIWNQTTSMSDTVNSTDF